MTNFDCLHSPDLPQYPNVDPFNYETMKKMLLEKLDSFQSAPFTIQRISELLSEPRKQYSRVDKFMRAVEKTILVVSTIPPGRTRTESSDSLDSGLNGDFSDVNVDVDMDGQDSHLNHKKNNNHEEKHESPAVASVSKHDENEEAKEENVKGTITKVTVDSVSITVIEPERSKTDETSKEQSPTKEAEEASPIAPIRSSENEILVETTEIISETPPLAALENIVATTTVKVDSTIVTPEIVVMSASAVIATEQNEPADYVESDETENAANLNEESSETEAKRIKLNEETETASLKSEQPTETNEKVEEVCEKSEDDAETTETQSSESSETPSTSSSSETEISQGETLSLPAVESEPTPIEEIVEKTPSTENEKVDEPTPVEVVPIEVQETVSDVTVAEMDAAPIPLPLAETKMDDEEQSTTAVAPVEQDMTPVASKMDTDESTTVEAAPMEFEDDAEPMDQ